MVDGPAIVIPRFQSKKGFSQLDHIYHQSASIVTNIETGDENQISVLFK